MAQVGIIMGSQSDLPVMEEAIEILKKFGIKTEVDIVSAHRTPDKMMDYGTSAHHRGIMVIIAGAGGAAHLPGILASLTQIPVLGVPIETKSLKGLDSLLSIVQMPAGISVPTFAIGKPGAINAALSAVSILSLNDPKIANKLNKYRTKQTQSIKKIPRKI